jgi:hypothetical protein
MGERADAAGRLNRSGHVLEFAAEFGNDQLDETQWLPFYLPQWTSRESSRARYAIGDGRLELRIERDQRPWSPELTGALRVSNLQTGVFSGPVGSGVGQHRFAEDLVVTEQQPERRLYLPHHGLIEARIAATGDPRSMVALWLIGFEDEPHRSAEICVFEIFGNEIGERSTLVGMGVHPFGDPAISDDFRKVPVAVDAREFHTYSALWSRGGVRFFVDDEPVASVDQSPDYPMQLMLDIYEFEPDPAGDYPKRLAVDWVRGWREA